MKRIIGYGQYVKVPSESRNIFHTVYTGDRHNRPHCDCENFRYSKRSPTEMFTCKHIKLVVYGKGAS